MKNVRPDQDERPLCEQTTLDRLAPAISVLSQIICVVAGAVVSWAGHIDRTEGFYFGYRFRFVAVVLPYVAMFLVVRRANWYGPSALLCLVGVLAGASAGVGVVIARGVLSGARMTGMVFIWVAVLQYLGTALFWAISWWMDSSQFQKREQQRDTLFFKEKLRSRKGGPPEV